MQDHITELKSSSSAHADAQQECASLIAAVLVETKIREGAGSRLNAAAARAANRADGAEPQQLRQALERAVAMYLHAWCRNQKEWRWQMISALSREAAQALRAALAAPQPSALQAEIMELQRAVQARIRADQRVPAPERNYLGVTA